MQFIVTGTDGTDAGALDRRMAVRQAHLETAKKMKESGKWLYAAAILDDQGDMCGSMIVCDFESEQALKSQWLDSEPYVTGKVWETVEIKRAAVAAFCAPQ